MLGLLAFVGALALVGVSVFTYFGGYWYELLRRKDADDG